MKTPRTDAATEAYLNGASTGGDILELSRQLERELAGAVEALADFREALEIIRDMTIDTDSRALARDILAKHREPK